MPMSTSIALRYFTIGRYIPMSLALALALVPALSVGADTPPFCTGWPGGSPRPLPRPSCFPRPTCPPPATAHTAAPMITSVSAVRDRAKQTIVIRGSGFGAQAGYVNQNSPCIAIHDETDTPVRSTHWEAGHVAAGNSDLVTLSVGRWKDKLIRVTGFGGVYGTGGQKLNVGDQIKFEVWNPETGAGPATYELIVNGGQDCAHS